MLDFRKPQAFSGRLSRGGDHHDVAFKLTLTPSGSLVFDFEELPFSRATAWLRGLDDPGERVSYFSLVAQSGEVTLTTDHLHLNAPVHDDQEGSYLALKGQAQLATLTAARTDEEPFLRMGLRGFRGFGRYQVETALGTIYVGGGSSKPVDDTISGFITLVAPSAVADLPAWRTEAGRLLEYLRLMTSFAAGRNLKGPTLEYASGTEWALEVLEQAGGGDSRVAKPKVLEAVTEAAGAQEAARIAGFKKADMAEAAERLVDGKGWLPVPLRTVSDAAEPEEPGAETLRDDDAYSFAAE